MRAHAEAVIDLADQHSLHYWRQSGLILKCWAIAQEGPADDGLALMRQTIASRSALGVGWYQVRYLCMLASRHLQHGAAWTGLRVLSQAKELASRNGERMWEAELARVEGELLRAQGALATEVEVCFRHALATARAQNARSFELRAAGSLARLWRDQGRRDEARDLLAPVYDRCTEGFDTPDLREAEASLGALT